MNQEQKTEQLKRWSQEKSYRDDRLNDCFFASSPSEIDSAFSKRLQAFADEKELAKERRRHDRNFVLQDLFDKNKIPDDKESHMFFVVRMGSSFISLHGTEDYSPLNAKIFDTEATAALEAYTQWISQAPSDEEQERKQKIVIEQANTAMAKFYAEREEDGNHETYEAA